MTEGIWADQGFDEGRLDAPVVGAYADRIWEGVQKGYDQEMPGIDWETPDGDMLRSLRDNVWQFSAAKTHQEMASISRELVGPDGRLRSFEDFRDAANRINIEHTRHLRTEYDTAVGSATMAAKWQQIQADKDTFPLLAFDAVIDGNTTDTCAGLDGVIRKVDDPFWSMYYPPNHWRCRSTVRQLTSGTETPDVEFQVPDSIPQLFRVNLGQQQLVFPPDHPYYQGLPATGAGSVKTFGGAEYQELLDRTGKGKVFESGLAYDPKRTKDVGYTEEYQSRRISADAIADYLDAQVYMTPELSSQADWRYEYFFEGNPYPGKVPDLKIGKEFWDVKSYREEFRRDKVSRMLSSASAQANQAVLKINHQLAPEYLEGLIADYFGKKNAKKNLKRILVVDDEGTVIVDITR